MDIVLTLLFVFLSSLMIGLIQWSDTVTDEGREKK